MKALLEAFLETEDNSISRVQVMPAVMGHEGRDSGPAKVRRRTSAIQVHEVVAWVIGRIEIKILSGRVRFNNFVLVSART